MLYIDLTDIIYFSSVSKHVTGIQRVGLSVAKALYNKENVSFIYCDINTRKWFQLLTIPCLFDSTIERFNVFNNNWRITKIKFSDIRRTIIREKTILRKLSKGQKIFFRFLLSKTFRKILPVPKEIKGFKLKEFRSSFFKNGDAYIIFSIPRNMNLYRQFLSKINPETKVSFFLHDMIPVITPEYCLKEERKNFERYLQLIYDFATDIITSADNNKKDIINYSIENGFLINNKKIHTVGLPVDFNHNISLDDFDRISPISLRLKNYKFCLSVGSIGPRKNHFEILQAWKKFYESKQYNNELLVIAGAPWSRAQDIVDLLRGKFCGGSIIFRPSPSDSEIAYLYKYCKFTITLSLYEGWGLPISESISFDKPVVTYDNSSLKEAGYDLANIVPRDINAVSNEYDRLFHNSEYYSSCVLKIKNNKHLLPSWEIFSDRIYHVLQ